MSKLYSALGGRKQVNGYLAAVALTLAAVLMNADFGAYATVLLATLGITNGSVALEDLGRTRAGVQGAVANASGDVADGQLVEVLPYVLVDEEDGVRETPQVRAPSGADGGA